MIEWWEILGYIGLWELGRFTSKQLWRLKKCQSCHKIMWTSKNGTVSTNKFPFDKYEHYECWAKNQKVDTI